MSEVPEIRSNGQAANDNAIVLNVRQAESSVRVEEGVKIADHRIAIGDRVTLHGGHTGEVVNVRTSSATPQALVYFGTIEPGMMGDDPLRMEKWIPVSRLEIVQ